MKKLKFIYEMKLEFDAPISCHYYHLHCRPKSAAGQRLHGYSLSLSGHDELGLYTDSFGNDYYSGRLMAAHNQVSFSCEGIVFTGIAECDRLFNSIYRYNTPHTACGAALTEFFQDNLQGGVSPFKQAEIFMQVLYENFLYMPGATDINTPAEQAFQQRSGVCQDYAHILLALCRNIGLPARYVAGLLIGEGASHAWIEVYADGYWIGLDPTHNRQVNEDYIKFAEGRDYKDCLINKGLFRGSAGQRQIIYANVEDML